ncbi:MAG TPA: hypothetical protein VF739_06125 [Ktedonobacterales bacterium]
MPLLTCPHCGSAVTTRDIETAPLRCPVCGAALTSAPAPEPAVSPAATPTALPIQEAEVRDASYHSGWQDRAEDDSATRAVARDKLEPISAQARTDHSYDQRAQVADEATHALPFSPEAHGAPPAIEPREATHALPLSAIPQEPPPTRRTPGLRAALLALAALALVVVIVVAALASNGLLGFFGGSTAPVPSAPLTPTSTPASVAFSQPGLYTVRYPQGWTRTQRNAAPQSYFTLLSSGSHASVDVEAQQINPAPSDLAALDEQTISTLAQPGTSPSNFSAATSITIGGQMWTRVTGDAQLIVPSGQPPTYGHVAALSTQRGPYTFTILCISTGSSADAARAAFTTDDQNVFQSLLASFTFLSQG